MVMYFCTVIQGRKSYLAYLRIVYVCLRTSAAVSTKPISTELSLVHSPFIQKRYGIYSVETTYGINSVISKLMTFVKNAEKGQFLFLIMVILSCFICS
jgi:hypothetical protein